MDTPLAAWRQQIEEVRAIEANRLVSAALEFLASPHAERAAALGWSELELFGMFSGPVSIAGRRTDASGLITLMTLSTSHSYEILAIEADEAVMQTGGGAMMRRRRRIPDERVSIPFWDHPEFRKRAN